MWSPQQEAALKAVKTWLRDPSGAQMFRLFGYAGTGKSTLAKALASDVRGGPVVFAAFTGKAALVMAKKGCHGASTIHSLIYHAREKADGTMEFVLNPMSRARSAGLIVIDECSMVGEELAVDLMSFGTRILVLGDPAQLPPVRGAGVFTEAEPDVMLTEIHRQAADNPIISMATKVREGGRLDYGSYGGSFVIPQGKLSRNAVLEAGVVLAGKNDTRKELNRKLRALHGRDSANPLPGDRLVCLKNNRERGLLNGGLWDVSKVVRIHPKRLDLITASADVPEAAPVRIDVRREFFDGTEATLKPEKRRESDEFTYGYALTVHKAQGSQWDKVVLFDESGVFREHRSRWLYTGLTRAAEAVLVVR
ncbi:ATP-dependent DNA helicase [Methylorubrum thiocyanatum]|uniref:ATP-dependent DNA helicase n=1 Tax=Methylorubrum thiocyanatum TaxID=47958 RepID=UPI00365590C4